MGNKVRFPRNQTFNKLHLLCQRFPLETEPLTSMAKISTKTIIALAIGFIGAIFIASMGYINDVVLGLESFTNGQLLPIIVIGILVLFVLLVNPLLGLCSRKLALSSRELALIVLLWSGACSIPGRGLLEQFTHTMIMPYHWNKVTAGWQRNNLLDYAPPSMLVDVNDKNYDETVSAYIFGAPKTTETQPPFGERFSHAVKRVPWEAWKRPLFTWMPLVLLSALASVCLAVITFKQWSEHEFLSFPIASFNAALIERDEGHLLPAICKSGLFWTGFIILLVIRINNGLVVWYPDYYIPVQLQWSLAPFSKVWPSLFKVQWGGDLLRFTFFPLVTAFAFFLSTEVSLTLGLSQICWVLFALPLVTIGMNLSTDWVGGWQGWQRAGSYIAMFCILLYTGRNYYGSLLKKALFPTAKSDMPPSGTWAMRILIITYLVMIWLVWRIGLELPFAIITVTLTLLSFVVVSRISAETGLFFIQPRWTIFGLLVAGLGSYAFPPQAIVICGFVCVMLCIDQCQSFMPFLTNGFKLCERSKVNTTGAGVASISMYAVACIIAVLAILISIYEFGGPITMNWGYQRLPTMPFRPALTEVLNLKALGLLTEANTLPWWQRFSLIQPKENFLGAFIFGIVAVWFFSILRLRVPKWPLHPVMFLLWATYPMSMTTHSMLIGWLLKKCVLRFGGIKMAKNMRPLMIGIIAGEVLSAVIFMIVGFIYYNNTGDKPLPYRWFPR